MPYSLSLTQASKTTDTLGKLSRNANHSECDFLVGESVSLIQIVKRDVSFSTSSVLRTVWCGLPISDIPTSTRVGGGFSTIVNVGSLGGDPGAKRRANGG